MPHAARVRHCRIRGILMFTKEQTNVCKGVGVLLLLFHHMYMSVSFTESMTLWFSDPTVLANIAVGMRVCVWIFAFLSAYGLTCKYNSLPESERRWFVPRQWLSLMKPFWLIFALTAVLYVILFVDLMGVYHYNGFFLAFDIFAVSDIMHTPKLLGVFWYMCFAQLVIFCIPVFNSFCRRFGYLSIPIAFIIMQFMGNGISTHNGGSYWDYLVVVVCGVVIAQKKLFCRIGAVKLHMALRIVLGVLLAAVGVGAIVLRQMAELGDVLHWRSVCSAVSAIAVCLLFGVFIRVKWLSKALAFLGRFSGLMFLIHSVLNNFVPQIIYLTHIAAVDYFIFVAETLLVSIAVHYLRRLIRYDKWFEKIGCFGKKSCAKMLR